MRRPTVRRTLLVPFLALLLALLAAPPGAAHPGAPPVPKTPYAGYLFAYFTGEGTADGEQIRYALSRGNDALRWRELNGGEPVLTSTTGERGLRDPFVIRSPDGDRFFMIATDLRMYRNSSGSWDEVQRHGSKSIMVWESTDLVHWTDQRLVEVAPDNAGNTWAPEAYWDDELDAYVVFWASKLYADDDPGHTGSTYNRMLYATTEDFRSFSEPKVWNDPGYSVIDSTVVEHEGTYYRYTKDERDPSSGSPCSKFVTAEKSTSLTDTSFDFVSDCIGRGAMERGEGPTVFKSNTEEKWYLFVDEYGGRGYLPFETTDLASGEWTPSTDYQLPASPRHGTVIPVTQAEYDRLLAAYPESPASVVDATARGQKGWAVVSEETSKVVLPMEPRANLRALAPRLYVGEGATVSPRSGTRRDFRRPQTYTVTAADGTRRVWTVEAVPTRSPVLPGLYADPDVRYMDGRYWIYPTTDGFPGWSGTRFKAFSSRDLVHWTDHGVVLDLGPDVAWADGNAWAPAIAERDGKYYFYFWRGAADRRRGGRLAGRPVQGRTGWTAGGQGPVQRSDDRPVRLHGRRRAVVPVLGQRARLRRPAQRRHGVLRRLPGGGHHPGELPRGLLRGEARRDLLLHVVRGRHPQRGLPRGLRDRPDPARPVDEAGHHPVQAPGVRHPRHRPPLRGQRPRHRRLVRRLPPLRPERPRRTGRGRHTPGDHDRPAALRGGRHDRTGGADPRVGQSGAAVTDSSQAKTSSCMRRGKACPVSGQISVRSRPAAPSESQTARSRA